MWEQVLTGKDKAYSIFSKEGEYCGSIELQNLETKTPEIGIDLLENKCNQGIGPRTVKIFAKACYEERKVDYFLIKISSRNSHSKCVFEKMGVILLKTTEGVFKTFIKDFKGRISDTVSVDEIEGNLILIANLVVNLSVLFFAGILQKKIAYAIMPVGKMK